MHPGSRARTGRRRRDGLGSGGRREAGRPERRWADDAEHGLLDDVVTGGNRVAGGSFLDAGCFVDAVSAGRTVSAGRIVDAVSAGRTASAGCFVGAIDAGRAVSAGRTAGRRLLARQPS